jgi:hypothetical protein
MKSLERPFTSEIKVVDVVAILSFFRLDWVGVQCTAPWVQDRKECIGWMPMPGFEKRGNSEDAKNGRVYGDDRS